MTLKQLNNWIKEAKHITTIGRGNILGIWRDDKIYQLNGQLYKIKFCDNNPCSYEPVTVQRVEKMVKVVTYE